MKDDLRCTTPMQAMPKSLNDEQLFRLVEIAHKTSNAEIRSVALAILNRGLHPAYFYSREGRR